MGVGFGGEGRGNGRAGEDLRSHPEWRACDFLLKTTRNIVNVVNTPSIQWLVMMNRGERKKRAGEKKGKGERKGGEEGRRSLLKGDTEKDGKKKEEEEEGGGARKKGKDRLHSCPLH